jgi:hypothetical protein
MYMKPPVVVVYKTIIRKKEVLQLEVFHDVSVDDLIDLKKTKPLIPKDSEIIEICIGMSFEEKYRLKYKINDVKKGENTNDILLKELQKVVNEQRGL